MQTFSEFQKIHDFVANESQQNGSSEKFEEEREGGSKVQPQYSLEILAAASRTRDASSRVRLFR